MNIEFNFPEDFWTPSAENKKKYFERINRGIKTASESSVCIISLVRDCISVIPFHVGRLEKLGNLFKSYDSIIFENDSSDGTDIFLKKTFATKTNHILISKYYGHERCGSDTSIERREKMAFYRNQYLNIIQQVNNDNSFDYIIICDEPIGGFSYLGIMNSLGFEKDWSVIGSNSLIYDYHEEKHRRLYYDSWAFDFLNEDNGPEYSKELQEKLNLMRYERGEEPFLVNSCFGGLAIYKSNILKNVQYNETNCDHKTIHSMIRANGHKIYMNPSQIALYNSHFYCDNCV